MRPVSFPRLLLLTACWTAAVAWAYLYLADGLLPTHPAKIGIQGVCVIGLVVIAALVNARSWLGVVAARPATQTAGFLLGLAIALVASGPALRNMWTAMKQLTGADLVIATLQPIVITYFVVFMPVSLLAWATALWWRRR